MSQENLEIARALLDAVNRGNVDEVLSHTHPEAVWEPLRSPVSGGYRGHEGVRRYLADTSESFDVFRIDPREIGYISGGLLLIGNLHVRVKHGGPELDTVGAGIAKFRDGRVLSWKDYGDRRLALEAAGLREEDLEPVDWG
jgi:ketosteroid isomerase-like protein